MGRGLFRQDQGAGVPDVKHGRELRMALIR